jgi:hypothetical protein
MRLPADVPQLQENATAPTLPLTSDRIGKVSLFWRTDLRLSGAVCGEIATSEALYLSNSALAASSDCSSILQYGHQTPR